MRIAIPTYDGKLAQHFGHCEAFVVVDVEDGTVTGSREAAPPVHAPGVLPRWLAEQGCSVIIAGGMGRRAQDLFTANGITVVYGAPALPAEDLVRQYLAGTLQTGDNLCDH